jgi:hypothetical protein
MFAVPFRQDLFLRPFLRGMHCQLCFHLRIRLSLATLRTLALFAAATLGMLAPAGIRATFYAEFSLCRQFREGLRFSMVVPCPATVLTALMILMFLTVLTILTVPAVMAVVLIMLHMLLTLLVSRICGMFSARMVLAAAVLTLPDLPFLPGFHIAVPALPFCPCLSGLCFHRGFFVILRLLASCDHISLHS